MRLFQVVVFMLVLAIATCDGMATGNNDQIAQAKPSSIFEGIRRFLFAEGSKSEERSYNAAVSSAGEGGRAGAGGGVTTTTTTSGGTVTISKYWNNGLLQRFKRWLQKIFHRSSSSSTHRLRQ
ncbi:hypothetical protein V7S43_015782 [Phytophthora oleae]|uniref:RxLR effector protein n=1 Tax=Phytophthora oleae TaxID=2107226 RepID=A0ABD3EYP9_9STRA